MGVGDLATIRSGHTDAPVPIDCLTRRGPTWLFWSHDRGALRSDDGGRTVQDTDRDDVARGLERRIALGPVAFVADAAAEICRRGPGRLELTDIVGRTISSPVEIPFEFDRIDALAVSVGLWLGTPAGLFHHPSPAEPTLRDARLHLADTRITHLRVPPLSPDTLLAFGAERVWRREGDPRTDAFVFRDAGSSADYVDEAQITRTPPWSWLWFRRADGRSTVRARSAGRDRGLSDGAFDDDRITAATRDPAGLWLATRDGVWRYSTTSLDDGRRLEPSAEPGLAAPTGLARHDGDLWTFEAGSIHRFGMASRPGDAVSRVGAPLLLSTETPTMPVELAPQSNGDLRVTTRSADAPFVACIRSPDRVVDCEASFHPPALNWLGDVTRSPAATELSTRITRNGQPAGSTSLPPFMGLYPAPTGQWALSSEALIRMEGPHPTK